MLDMFHYIKTKKYLCYKSVEKLVKKCLFGIDSYISFNFVYLQSCFIDFKMNYAVYLNILTNII
uniref:Uncharacterized protein n=1 Tax=Heterorhabditis bacteriophora TaxID=37862 RepID=A0A1I7WA87_HETBA